MSCTWLGPDQAGPLGICFNDQGGATQGQTCNTQYDAQGNLTMDSCNRTRNAICWGASPMNPIGVCTTICGLNNPALCSAMGNYTCDDLDDPSNGYGVCLEPAPNYTDLGTSCQAAPNCQGNLCSMSLANSCSADCAGLATCPANSYCLNLQEGPSCAQGCTHKRHHGRRRVLPRPQPGHGLRKPRQHDAHRHLHPRLPGHVAVPHGPDLQQRPLHLAQRVSDVFFPAFGCRDGDRVTGLRLSRAA